jgi:hypothetical protein
MPQYPNFIGLSRYKGSWSATNNIAVTSDSTPLTIEGLFGEGDSSTWGGIGTTSGSSGGYSLSASCTTNLTGTGANFSASAGDFWKCTDGSTKTIDGSQSWADGDFIIYTSGSEWIRLFSGDVQSSVVVGNMSSGTLSNALLTNVNADSGSSILYQHYDDGTASFSGSHQFTFNPVGPVVELTGNMVMTGNLYVEGVIYGNQYTVTTVRETVNNIHVSGATKFGDTVDDVHQRTGSLHITGTHTTNPAAEGYTLFVNGPAKIGNAWHDKHLITGQLTASNLELLGYEIYPATNNQVDLGRGTQQFKDLFLDGTAHIDQLLVTGEGQGYIENTVIGGTTSTNSRFASLNVTGSLTASGQIEANSLHLTLYNPAGTPTADRGPALSASSADFTQRVNMSGTVHFVSSSTFTISGAHIDAWRVNTNQLIVTGGVAQCIVLNVTGVGVGGAARRVVLNGNATGSWIGSAYTNTYRTVEIQNKGASVIKAWEYAGSGRWVDYNADKYDMPFQWYGTTTGSLAEWRYDPNAMGSNGTPHWYFARNQVGGVTIGSKDSPKTRLWVSGNISASTGLYSGDLFATGTVKAGTISGSALQVNKDGLTISEVAVTTTAAELNILDGVTATSAQLNYNASVTAGTAAASKTLVLDSDSRVSGIAAIDATTISGSGGYFHGDLHVSGNITLGDEDSDVTMLTQLTASVGLSSSLGQFTTLQVGGANIGSGSTPWRHTGSSIFYTNGPVGIGATNPGAQFEVHDTTTTSANTGGKIRLSANDGAAMGDSHRLGVIEFAGAEDTDNTQVVGARIEALTDAAWTNAENGCALYFYTTDDNASQSNVLKLDSNEKATFSGDAAIAGNVGVGLTSPASKFHVSGTAYLSGTNFNGLPGGQDPVKITGLRTGSIAGPTSYLSVDSDGKVVLSHLVHATGSSGTVTAINNQTVNRLVTLGSTTTELDGEANATFDGTTLNITGTLRANTITGVSHFTSSNATVTTRVSGAYFIVPGVSRFYIGLETDAANAVDATAAQINFNAGVTAGTAAASKALVLDAGKHVGTITSLTASALTGGVGSVISADTVSAMGGKLKIGDVAVTATAAEINFNDVTAGTATASKSLVLDAGKHIGVITSITASHMTGGHIYAQHITGNLIQSAKLIRSNTISGSNLQIGNGSAWVTGTIYASTLSGTTATINAGGLKIDNVAVTSTAAEINFNDVTAGTATASKSLVLDAGKHIGVITSITASHMTGGHIYAQHVTGNLIQSAKLIKSDTLSGSNLQISNGDAFISGTLTVGGGLNLDSFSDDITFASVNNIFSYNLWKSNASAGTQIENTNGKLNISGSDGVYLQTTASAEVAINDGGWPSNFRVESDAETRMLFVDGSENRVFIGNSVDSLAPSGTLEVTNHATAGAYNVPLLQLNNNDTNQIALDINAANIDADVIDIAADAVTTANVIDITADGLTSGKALNVNSNSSDTTAREVAYISNDNASSEASTLRLYNRTTFPALVCQGRITTGLGSTSSNNTAGQTISAAQLIHGAWAAAGRNASQDDTTPTAAQIVAAIPNCAAGDSFEFIFLNVSGNAVDLVGGTGVTNLSGGAASFAVAAGKGRKFRFRVSNISGGSEAVTVWAETDDFTHSS